LELRTERTGLKGFVRPQDLFWVLLFAALAIFGPHRSPAMMILLCVLGLFQVIEPRVLAMKHGTVSSFAFKLVVCYALIFWTEGIASSYFWMLLLPVVTAATNTTLMRTIIAAEIACLTYVSFLLLIPGEDLYPEAIGELIMRMLLLPVVGFLAHQLAESTRAAAAKYQATAEQLAEANQSLREAEATVRRTDRLAALGQLSAGLAHELRNPLGIIKASAELLGKSIGPGEDVAREMAEYISTEVDRTNSLVTRFLDFARPLAIRPEKADLSQVIDRAIDQVERHQPPFDVSIYKNYSSDIGPFMLDGELMERVLYNLIMNAAQASPPQGTITVKTREMEDMVEIAVIDRGSGIEPKHLENIFNPFFTTKRGGVGLGLAIVSKIVDEHGGRITVESEAGQGTVFRVYLPIKEK
jgi:two-component system sensor histidine kinase HydH